MDTVYIYIYMVWMRVLILSRPYLLPLKLSFVRKEKLSPQPLAFSSRALSHSHPSPLYTIGTWTHLEVATISKGRP
jgi:hypothetical protein